MLRQGDSFDVSEWTTSVKKIYESSKGYKAFCRSDQKFGGRLIPLCTPAVMKPSALVIGTNHSVFVDGGGPKSEELARNYAGDNLKKRNTLVDDHHRFARNLRNLVARAGQRVGRDWVGTNRCAIQTGEIGIDEFKSSHWHIAAQSAMDQLLFQLIGHLQPKNLILCGNYAAELMFGPGAQISRLNPTKKRIVFRHQQSGVASEFVANAIPVWHPSRVRYQPYADNMRGAWET